ncbi:procathepsin L-like [Ptychodera flava]|uniref:procathepsin L-like n=1 Tax=Ptychodera flava TaxID=63121 RepID=UPI00396A5C6A
MKIVLCFALVAMAMASPLDLNRGWELWKTTHGKVYTPEEEVMRKQTWQQNMKMIHNHNTDYQNGKKSFRMAMNQFGDMETGEFKSVMNGYKVRQRSRGSTYVPPSNVVLPDHVDWRDKGYVTPVKNQQACGSCWAFSSTGSLEGQTFKKTGKLISLSEQQLVDCSRSYGNEGCGGGWMDRAFDYIKDMGEESEADYPYTATDDPCTYSASKVVAEDTGHTDIMSMDENDLQNAIATVGPISVAIDAGHSSFQFYSSGVYDEPACSQTILDHGVLAVGYGATEQGQDYYIVKNSWGETWGNQGYIWMSRNKNNQCGIATNASYPLV